MLHSTIVGGSTAKRVMKCPASVALCAKMPPKPSSVYADTGTLLHNIIAEVLDKNLVPEMLLGTKYNDVVFTQELLDTKVAPALAALEEIDPGKQLNFTIEAEVSFGEFIPGAFGSADLLGRIEDRVILLDWKFGDGVPVEAEENPQLMYYVAAAMRTKGLEWAFENAREVECIIVQPPSIKRWATSFDRIRQFERELLHAVFLAKGHNPPLHAGDHCRWCAAKPVCPLLTGAVDRALQAQIQALDAQQLSAALDKAEILEQWISDLRALACQLLDAGGSVPGYKLVAKRATRKWVDEDAAKVALRQHLPESELMETSLISPAQAEKKLKKLKVALPEDIVVAVSTGNTLVPMSDPRPEVLQIGRQLTAALSKIV